MRPKSEMLGVVFRRIAGLVSMGAAPRGRPGKRGTKGHWRSLPHLEELEARQLLACDLPGATCIAAIGDYGADGSNELGVAELIKSWDPEMIVTVGDNNYSSGSAATIDANIGKYFHEFISPYVGNYGPGAEVNRFYPAMGNADWGNQGQPYFDYFALPGNERYYAVSAGPIDFFIVDSDTREPDGVTSDSVQGNWLREALAGSSAAFKIVLLHHAPYSSGRSHPDLQWPFSQWGATMIMAGHDHWYERGEIDGLPYFVNGLGGRSIRSYGTPLDGTLVQYNGDYGAMLLQANQQQLELQFINRSGEIIDSHTIVADTSLTVTDVAVNATLLDPADLDQGEQPTSWLQQRSAARSIQVTFSKDIQATNEDLILTNLGINAPLDTDEVIALDEQQVDVQGNQLTIHFEAGELSDGIYELTVLPTVTDESGSALDGDGDGTGGDAFVLTGKLTNRFFQLTGDWNADGGVSIFDFSTLAYWFGKATNVAPAYVDLNGDLGISVFDFPLFARKFGDSVTPPVALVPPLPSHDLMHSAGKVRQIAPPDRKRPELESQTTDPGLGRQPQSSRPKSATDHASRKGPKNENDSSDLIGETTIVRKILSACLIWVGPGPP